MSKVMIFGGTTEGRLLADACIRLRLPAAVFVVSSYGKEVLSRDRSLQVITGALTEEEMERFICSHKPSLVLDATHPYACEASENIKRACENTSAAYVRVLREAAVGSGEDQGDIRIAAHAREAAEYLSRQEGNILVTTGSKELSEFTAVRGYEERVYARILPSSRVLAACEKLGIKGGHLIAMQGPFSVEMNVALIKQFKIRHLVTKESGAAGGFEEKLKAARLCQAATVVIGRPKSGEGISLDKAVKLLEGVSKAEPRPRPVFLIGTGMGGPGQMTGEAALAMNSCQVLFGAKRMLQSALSQDWNDKHKEGRPLVIQEYAPDRIAAWLKDHPLSEPVGVLYSGDPGFYSGAQGLLKALKEDAELKDCRVTLYPGISTLSYLCARAGAAWEDVAWVSLHGRDQDVLLELTNHRRVFVLLGGKWGVKELCVRLLSAGFDAVRLTVGEALSYPEERIVQGAPSQLVNQSFGSLCAVLMERTEEGHPKGGNTDE